MKLLWKMFPRAAFFEVYVPAREKGTAPQLPLIVESTDGRLVEPYTKMFYRLFTARDVPIFRILFVNANCDPIISHRVAANLGIMLASEDIVTYIIDLDMVEPTLHDVFHVERTPGMVEYLLKGIEPEEIIRETGVPELKFVPSGSEIMEPAEVISTLAWRNSLERLIPPGVVSLIDVGRGGGFDLSELMKEIDGTLLLISSGEKIDRWVKKELKRIKKGSDVVGVIWTNPMEYPFRRMDRDMFEDGGPGGEEEGMQTDYPLIDEDDFGLGKEGITEAEVDRGGSGRVDGFDPTFASRDAITTFANRLSEWDSMNRKGDHETDAEDYGPASGGVEAGRVEGEAHDQEIEEENGGVMNDARKPGRDLEEGREEQELDMGDDDLEREGSDLFEGGRGGYRKNAIKFAFFGIIFVILIAWLLYEWGFFARDERLKERLTGGGGTEEVPAEVVPGGEPGMAEEVAGGEPGVAEETPARGVGAETPAAPAAIPSYVDDAPFSIVLASFQHLDSAEKAKEQLIRAGFDAYLVPVEIPGRGRWVRVMTGQFADKDEARSRLQEVGMPGGFGKGRVVESSLAFLMGGFSSRQLAEQAFDGIKAKGLDPYILESGEKEKVYFVYLGAFENEEQAGYLGDILEEKGLSGSLVNRKGLHL